MSQLPLGFPPCRRRPRALSWLPQCTNRPSRKRPAAARRGVITRAVFAVRLPILAALIGLLGVVVAAVALFAVHPALALVPLAALGGAAYLFACWERSRFRPPGRN